MLTLTSVSSLMPTLDRPIRPSSRGMVSILGIWDPRVYRSCDVSSRVEYVWATVVLAPGRPALAMLVAPFLAAGCSYAGGFTPPPSPT